MKRCIATFTFCLVAILAKAQYKLLSPDKSIAVTIQTGKDVSYTVQVKGESVVLPSNINLALHNGTGLLTNARVKKVHRQSVQNTIISPVQEKRKVIPDVYNEIKIDFQRPVSLIVRAYNDGVAYRFETRFKDSIVVKEELASFRFSSQAIAYYTEVQKREQADIFHTSFEENYFIKPIDSIGNENISFTPTLIATHAAKVVVTESDLEDYPGMFLRGSSHQALQGVFAPYPLEEKITEGEFPQAIVTRRADYIARTKGSRVFPWRVLAIAGSDKELPVNDIVYRLAPPSRVPDVSWIKPGKSTEEWIIGINLFNVPFKAGINTATYKYYIDFARRFGLERILLDAGWSDNKDLFKVNPALDMDTLAAYAQTRGIGLSMWTLALTLDRQLDSALQQFKKWGVDFIMTDFIDRDDQKMVNFHHRIAQACAQQKIMVMYHGSFKPAGFNRTYPNAVTREGVLGSEYNGWSNKATPDHNVLLPFIRMISGPLDYEPGLLDNGTKETFRPIWNKVMSQGTRCHQLAMFVVYDSPMQLFSGNPSQGLMEPQFMELLGSIPTTWDETLIADARLGEYIITARKKGSDWFVGGMSNGTGRTLALPLSFLDDGTYQATLCEDGVNADRYASDYTINEKQLQKEDTLSIKMAPGGGFLVRFKKIK